MDCATSTIATVSPRSSSAAGRSPSTIRLPSMIASVSVSQPCLTPLHSSLSSCATLFAAVGQVQPRADKLLNQAIVQVVGDQLALFFLRVDQLLDQAVFLAALAFQFLRHFAERARQRADFVAREALRQRRSGSAMPKSRRLPLQIRAAA